MKLRPSQGLETLTRTATAELTEGKSTEGKSTEGKLTEGKSTEGKLTEGKYNFRSGEQVVYYTGHLTTNQPIPCIAFVQSQSPVHAGQWLVCYFIAGSSNVHWNTVGVSEEPKVGFISPRRE